MCFIVMWYFQVTPEEAKHLMFLGVRKGMEKALIVPYGGKHLTQSSTRTNSAAWLDFAQVLL